MKYKLPPSFAGQKSKRQLEYNITPGYINLVYEKNKQVNRSSKLWCNLMAKTEKQIPMLVL